MSDIIIEKSAYAAYNESKNVTPIGVYVDTPLAELTKAAAKKAGKKHAVWVRDVFAEAVRAQGFTYTAPTPTNLKAEIAAKDAELEKLRKELAALRTPPTPPAAAANPTTGKVEAKS